MSKHQEEIKREQSTMPGRDDDYKYSHPSYGMISVSRYTGGGGDPMFGSEVESNGGIRIAIHEANVEQSLGRNWYHSNKLITEIRMTPVQYAEMISNPNTQGVPCTVAFTQDLGHIEYKGINTVTEHVESKIDSKVTELKSRISTIDKQVSDILTQKGTLKKADKDQIRSLVSKMVVDLCSNMEFYEKSLKESIDRTKMEAKTEIESYLTNAIARIGAKALEDPETLKLVLASEDE